MENKSEIIEKARKKLIEDYDEDPTIWGLTSRKEIINKLNEAGITDRQYWLNNTLFTEEFTHENEKYVIFSEKYGDGWSIVKKNELDLIV